MSGIPVPDSYEGVSLAGILRQEDSARLPEQVFMEGGHEPEQSQLVVREGQWKLIHVRSKAERLQMAGEEFELYDLEADPGELANVSEQHPEIVARLQEKLMSWYLGGPRPTDVGPAVDLEKLDERSQGMLKALGYLK
jgi:arylsulfatase A-like enzyme